MVHDHSQPIGFPHRRGWRSRRLRRRLLRNAEWARQVRAAATVGSWLDDERG